MRLTPSMFRNDPNTIIIRTPEVHEGEALLSYFRALFHESSQFMKFSSQFYDQQTKDFQEKFIESFNASERSFVLLAYAGISIIGHIIIDNYGFERANHRAKLVMGLLKQYEGIGLGSALLTRAIDAAEQSGNLVLELQVKSFNNRAIKLYEKFNFEKVGCIRAAAHIDDEYYDELIYQYIFPSLQLKLNHSANEQLLDSNANVNHSQRLFGI